MVRPQPEQILLIGDSQRQVETVLAQAMPAAQVTAVPTIFDGIAELAARSFSTVLAHAEPIERRPEPAIRTLREMAGEARLALFGHPTLEPLARKMLEFGCDDYIISPTSPEELYQVFGAPVAPVQPKPASAVVMEPAPAEPAATPLLNGLPLAELFLSALLEHPNSAPTEAVKQLNKLLSPQVRLEFHPASQPPKGIAPAEGQIALSHTVRAVGQDLGQLHLLLGPGEDANAARQLLARIAGLLCQLAGLQQRHDRLQRLAITDEMTGLYNARYFRHFLSRILDMARAKRFPVALFIFDIDNFKRYNDQFGHGVGDEILKATSEMIRRSCRDHDLVARIGGDEFAVVFWEKDGPRQPRDPKLARTSRALQTPLDILNRFRRHLANQEFTSLGASGKGVLTISGALAVYPYDARTMDELIDVADKQLMLKAKQSGKNRIYLVGSGEELPHQAK